MFNKRDLFEETYDEEAFKDCFPNFTSHGMASALEFIKNEFALRMLYNREQRLHTRVLSALEPDDIKLAWEELRATLLHYSQPL
jgi:hypothetical protein